MYSDAMTRFERAEFSFPCRTVTCDVFGCVVRSRRMNPFLVDFLFLPVRCRVQFVSPVSYWRLYDSP